MSSKKMNQRSQIKRGKTKRSEDKMDKAMSDIKKIGIISCCLVAVLLVVGIFVNPKESYAAGFLTEVPDKFISKVNDYNGKPPAPGNRHILIKGTDAYTGINISLPWEFSGYEAILDENGEISDKNGNKYNKGNEISFIYCVDRKKEMASNLIYNKGESVKGQISLDSQNIINSYPGLVYIILNDNIVEDNKLSIPDGDTAEAMNYYLAQVAIWYYIDEVNGNDYNFSQDEKAVIDSDSTYGPVIKKLVEGAIAYQDTTSTDNYITVDESNISYSIVGDYIETSIITPVGSNSYFNNYSVQVDNSSSNIEILDANGNPVTGLINANEGFKVRIPVSATQNNDFNLPITIVGYFSNNYDAYVYIPDNSEAQRALLGKLERVSTPTTFYLKAPTLNVPDTNSTSYIVYGIGALIIIAGIVLIVMAKGPKNAKKK